MLSLSPNLDFFCTHVFIFREIAFENPAVDGIAAVCFGLFVQAVSCRQNPSRSNECPAAHVPSVSTTANATHVREPAHRGFVSSLSPHIYKTLVLERSVCTTMYFSSLL